MNFLRQYWLLLILALPFFVALDESSLWDANEAFYAQTPREMVDRGDWLVPYFNGKPRLNKPPLSYWVVAVFYNLFSISVFWERFPMALLACGSVLSVFAIGKTLYNQKVALWAAGIFATTFRFLFLARRLMIDVLLLFCLLLAIACFLSWIKSERKSHFLLASFFFGLAFLAKGPVALLALIFLGLYLFITERRGRLSRAPWLTASLICLLTCSSWFLLLGAETGWQPVRDFFLKENLGRFTSVAFGPERGPFYYAGVFVGDFFPWSFFFPAAVIWSFLLWRRGGTGVDADRVLLLSLWIGAYFLFFSLAYNKQEYYILPLYPAAALWVALYFERARAPALLSGLVAVLILIFSALLFFIARALFENEGLWIPFLFVPPVVLGLFLRRYSLTIASLALFYFATFALYLRPFEEYKPVYHFAQTILDRTGQAKESQSFQAGYYKFAAPSLAFYLNQPIVELFDVKAAAALLESEMPVYLIVRADHYAELTSATASPLQIVEVRPKLYTTVGALIEGFKGGRTEHPREAWTRPVYLITNGNSD